MAGEIPGSSEPYDRHPLSDEQLQILAGLEADLAKDDNATQIEDKKRPLPDEIEWGLPGADTEQ